MYAIIVILNVIMYLLSQMRRGFTPGFVNDKNGYTGLASDKAYQFLVGFVLLDLLFYMYVLLIVVCPFVHFLLAIVLSVLLDIRILFTPLVSSNSSYPSR